MNNCLCNAFDNNWLDPCRLPYRVLLLRLQQLSKHEAALTAMLSPVRNATGLACFLFGNIYQ